MKKKITVSAVSEVRRRVVISSRLNGQPVPPSGVRNNYTYPFPRRVRPVNRQAVKNWVIQFFKDNYEPGQELVWFQVQRVESVFVSGNVLVPDLGSQQDLTPLLIIPGLGDKFFTLAELKTIQEEFSKVTFLELHKKVELIEKVINENGLFGNVNSKRFLSDKIDEIIEGYKDVEPKEWRKRKLKFLMLKEHRMFINVPVDAEFC